jgi:hypothetical protein
MELQSANTVLGIPKGVLYKSDDRVEELNTRHTQRQFPDAPLEPNYDPRPISTKYSQFPVLNERKPIEHTRELFVTHTMNNFNPGSHNGPSSGYRANVDVEMELRNQNHPLQNGNTMHTFVPSSNSDLYKTIVPVGASKPQPHPTLFDKPSFSSQIHPNLEDTPIGTELFNNHTRTQLRNMI